MWFWAVGWGGACGSDGWMWGHEIHDTKHVTEGDESVFRAGNRRGLCNRKGNVSDWIGLDWIVGLVAMGLPRSRSQRFLCFYYVVFVAETDRSLFGPIRGCHVGLRCYISFP